MTPLPHHRVKSVQTRGFFWSVFGHFSRTPFLFQAQFSSGATNRASVTKTATNSTTTKNHKTNQRTKKLLQK